MTTNSSNISGDSVDELQLSKPTLKHFPPYKELYWIVCEAILIIITFITLCLLVCLLRYANITKCRPGKEITGSRKGTILFQMCLLSVVMAIGRLVADQFVAILGWQSNSGCSNAVATSAVFYSLSLYPVYIFLWLRQSIFYASPVLLHVLNPTITFASWLTLIFMLLGGAVITVFYVIPDLNGWNYVASPTGCRDISDLSGFELVPTILVCFTVCFQLSLLGLFIYPLLSEKTQRYRSAFRNNLNSNRDQVNSAVSEGNEDDSSNPKGSNELESSDQKRISDVNFESLDANPSFIESLSSSNSRASKSFEIKKENVLSSKQNNVKLNNIYNGQLNGVKKKKKMTSNNSTSSFFNLTKRGRSVSLNSASDGANKSKRCKRSKTQQGRRVIKFIRKAFLLALICVISDVVFTVTQLMIVAAELVYLVLFDINLLINIFCIIMSFREWKSMILPFCVCSSKRKSRYHKNGEVSNHVYCQHNHLSQASTAGYKSKITNQIPFMDHVTSAIDGPIVRQA